MIKWLKIGKIALYTLKNLNRPQIPSSFLLKKVKIFIELIFGATLKFVL
jgi:hypothetical protein